MNFVYPNFLWAYLLIAIPIVIHLFNFRKYKTVYFSRVKFLREVTEDSRSGNKLKHLLILLMRILTIICLVTAFAQPFIPLENSANTENVTSIYIDNSFSMQAKGKDGDLLNEAKNQAIELVRTLDANEKVNLITSDVLSIHQRFYSKSEIIDMIKEIDYSAKSTSLSNVLNLQMDLLSALQEQVNQRLFVFSDFQKSSTSLENFNRNEIPLFYYKTEPERAGNIYIDSVWFLSPVHRVNTPIELIFRVYNQTANDQNDLTVNLKVNGGSPETKRISVLANSFVNDTIKFTDRKAGIRNGVISIATSQLNFDDEFYFSYDIKEEVRILLITDPSDKTVNIEQLYGLNDYYNCSLANINTVSQEDFNEKELIILQNINKIPSGIYELMEDGLKKGASVILIPGTNVELKSWNNFLTKHQLPTFLNMDSTRASLSYFNYNDPLYEGVFIGNPANYKLAKLKATYGLFVSNSNNFITLFGTSESSPFLLYSKQANGRLILMSAPLKLAYSDFQNHALFAATMLRFAETASFQKPLYMSIGALKNYPLNAEINEKSPIKLVNEEFAVEVIPQLINTNSSRLISFSHLEDHIKRAGVYELKNEDGFFENLAINYNRVESVTEAYSQEEIEANFEAVGWSNVSEITINDSGKIEINKFNAKEYWRILLILALIFIAAEIILLKLWNAAGLKR